VQHARQADVEEELPRQRIEEPEAGLRVIRRGDLVDPGNQPQSSGQGERRKRPVTDEQQEGWRHQQQDRIDRQDVVVAKLMAKRDDADQHMLRVPDQWLDVDQRQQVRPLREHRRRAEDGQHRHRRNNVGDIEHSGAAPQFQCRQEPVSGLEF
jgi:hypothetical protein